jgi:hypothetical protein
VTGEVDFNGGSSCFESGTGNTGDLDGFGSFFFTTRPFSIPFTPFLAGVAFMVGAGFSSGTEGTGDVEGPGRAF